MKIILIIAQTEKSIYKQATRKNLIIEVRCYRFWEVVLVMFIGTRREAFTRNVNNRRDQTALCGESTLWLVALAKKAAISTLLRMAKCSDLGFSSYF